MLGPKLLLLILPASRTFACEGTPSSQSDIDELRLSLLVDSFPVPWSESTTETGLNFGKIRTCCFKGDTHSVSDFTEMELLRP